MSRPSTVSKVSSSTIPAARPGIDTGDGDGIAALSGAQAHSDSRQIRQSVQHNSFLMGDPPRDR